MSLRDEVLTLLESRPEEGFTLNRMASELGFTGKKRFALEGVVRALEAQGLVERARRLVRLSRRPRAVAGVFHSARGGFGFLTPETGGEDHFVPPGRTGGALEGDRVSAHIVPGRGGRGRPEAHVARILSRTARPVVGLVQCGRVLPLGGSQPSIAVRDSADLEGRIVAVVPGPDPEAPSASSVVLVGDMDDASTPIRAAEGRFGLEAEFPPEVEAEASAASAWNADSGEGRKDLRGLPTLTLDPADARDHDDALSVRREAEGFRLWVHIADVSSFVRRGTALDREARRRGNSVYLPGTVYPMLPRALSAEACSLLEGRGRPAVTVDLTVDPSGRVRRAGFYRSLILADAVLSYEEAQARLEEGDREASDLTRLLHDASDLSKALFKHRLSLGTLDLDLPEASLRFGLTGKVEEILPSVRLATHRVVEEAMLAANVAVARELARRGSLALFRVHDPPDPEKLEALRPLLNALGLGASGLRDLSDPRALQTILRRCEGHRAAKLVSYLILRAMAQARYAPSPRLHYGLGFRTYCHFTSPIRRYPDLVVHRALLGEVSEKEDAVEDLANHCSSTERAADLAEREVVAWHQMAFLSGRLGDVFQAIVLGFTRFGVRIELVDHLIEGVCPFFLVEGDYLTVERDGLSARGRVSGARIQVGDLVPMRLVRVDRLVGEAQFAPESWPAEARGQARRRRGGPPRV
jgi:ribonuclease R